MCVCTWPVCLVPAYGGQRVSDPLELDHQTGMWVPGSSPCPLEERLIDALSS